MESFQFDFQEDPGYQFAQDEGSQAIQNMMAARGLTGSGREMKELARFSTGLAGQRYGQARQQALAEHQARQGQRMGLARMGQAESQFQRNLAQRGAEFGAGMQERRLQNQLRSELGLAGMGLDLVGRQAGLRTGLADRLAELELGRGQAGATRMMGEAGARRNFMSDLMALVGRRPSPSQPMSAEPTSFIPQNQGLGIG